MSDRSFRSPTMIAVVATTLLAFAPGGAAGAQVTPYVAHPRKPADTTTRPPLARSRPDTSQRARIAAARRAEITNMKAWVDSAAIAAGTRIPLPLDSSRTPSARRSVDTTFIRAELPPGVSPSTPVVPAAPVVAAETPLPPAEAPSPNPRRTWDDRPVRESAPLAPAAPAAPAADVGEGLVAPDTASSLPALLLGGVVATLAGLGQLRRRR